MCSPAQLVTENPRVLRWVSGEMKVQELHTGSDMSERQGYQLRFVFLFASNIYENNLKALFYVCS